MQICEIYFRNECLYVVSQSFSDVGVGISVGPNFKADLHSPHDIGIAVSAALDASRKGIPHPKHKADMEIIRSRILSFVGVKNWRDFIKNTKLISVERVGPDVVVKLNQTVPGGGFVATDSYSSCSVDNHIEIGNCVQQLIGLPDDASMRT